MSSVETEQKNEDVLVTNIPCRLLIIGYYRTHGKQSFLPNDIVSLCIDYCFNLLHRLLTDYEYLLQFSITQDRITQQVQIQKVLNRIRQFVLINGVTDNYSLSNHSTKFHNDTLRGKLWRLMLGMNSITMNVAKYESTMTHCSKYEAIRSTTQRVYLTWDDFHQRVDETQLVRIMNAYCNTNADNNFASETPYYVGIILYTMPELYAYYTFKMLVEKHIPTYVHLGQNKTSKDCGGIRPKIGVYAGADIGNQILNFLDKELHAHIFGSHSLYNIWLVPMMTMQTICQPYTEMIKLWDFMCCFGMHLCPVITATSIISKKKEILAETDPSRLLNGILSSRKWLNRDIDAKKIIEITMDAIFQLKQNKKELWTFVLNHASNFDTATETHYKYEPKL